MSDIADLRALVARFRELAAFAAAGGAAGSWLEETAGAVVDALGELDQRRRGDRDPRRLRSLDTGRAIQRARAAGATMKQLEERFGIGRTQIWRLERLVARHDATVLVSTAPRANVGKRRA
jgi:hypothetical protein